ncbi:MAG: CPBP family intramembrane glutamic endopeptidase [Chitinophagales bacterium]
MNSGRYLMDGMHPLLQLLLLTSLTLIFIFLFTILGMFLVRPMFGITTIDVVMQNAMSNTNAVAMNPNQVNAIKLLQFMSSLGGFLVPALLFAFIKFPGGDFLFLNRKFNAMLLLLAVVVLAAAGPFISFAYTINQQLDLPAFLDSVEKIMKESTASNEKITSLFLRMPTQSDLFINLIVIAILPAIAEELFFRGCIQQVMKEWLKSVHIAIWITAFIFSFIHFEFYGFVPRMMLGGLLGYLFYWSGSLWVPILAHAFINGGQIVLAYLHEHEFIQFNVAGEDALPTVVVLVCTVLLAGLLFIFKKVSDRQKFIY